MKFRILCLVLAVWMTVGTLSGCSVTPARTEDTTKAAQTDAAEKTVTPIVKSFPVTVEGSIFGGDADSRIQTQLNFDSSWLTNGDNSKYNKDLAAFSALISADTYFRQKDLERGTQNRVLIDGKDTELYDPTVLLREIGFSDVQYIETYKAKEYTSDTNDSATIAMGYLNLEDRYDVFVVAFRGCFSSQEWLSVYDPGDSGAGYASYTGEHPEWKEPAHYKGLDIAAQRAKEFIDEFIAAHDTESGENRILLCGHSRGGMIANMLGAAMEKEYADGAFTYTFNTSPTTTDRKAGEYRTIFNLFDENDFYTDILCFGGERFYRYGKNLTAAIDGNAEIKEAIAQYKGEDNYSAVDADGLAAYRSMFGAAFPDRPSLYKAITYTETFSTQEEAENRAEEWRTLAGSEAGLGLEPFCTVGDAQKTEDGYSASMEYCGGALLFGFSKILAYGDAAHDAFVTLFETETDACNIADFLSEHAAGISGAHRLLNTYVLTQFVTE